MYQQNPNAKGQPNPRFDTRQPHRPSEDFFEDGSFALDLPYATAFVRPQILREIYSPAQGFANGTIFPELYSPYGQ